jgi:uncharacterized protein (TIGR02444 family)
LSPQTSSDSASGKLQYDNELWQFSLAVYAQNGVADECLTLQQQIGLDINMLLFCAWIGVRGGILSSADIEAAMRNVAHWQDRVVRPLRSVRQEIKKLGQRDLEGFRERIKSIELEAEQIEQALLFGFSESLQSGQANAHDAVPQNIKKYIARKSGSNGAQFSAPLLVDAALRLHS